MDLLRRVSTVDPPWTVPDAIVVPTARPVAYLRTAMGLARDLECKLLVLCSRYARAAEVAAQAVTIGADALTVDIDETATTLPFETSALLADSKFERKGDTSQKRNMALAVARMAGWRNVVFLDDDMAVDTADHLVAAVTLLKSFDAVGLANIGFPDNSVVCHARRIVGDFQDSFIGGGALAVPVHRVKSFFPNIYNEDWFFLLNDDRLSPAAVTGSVVQKEFDPFASPRRARSEELGDCLAEGVYALLDEGRRVQDADGTFWQRFLDHRRQLIADVIDRVAAMKGHDEAGKVRMIEALKAAQGRRESITPELCVAYLRAWAADRKGWQAYLRRLPSCSPTEALERLGLKAARPDAYRAGAAGRLPGLRESGHPPAR